jgi:hypothetical protein
MNELENYLKEVEGRKERHIKVSYKQGDEGMEQNLECPVTEDIPTLIKIIRVQADALNAIKSGAVSRDRKPGVTPRKRCRAILETCQQLAKERLG